MNEEKYIYSVDWYGKIHHSLFYTLEEAKDYINREMEDGFVSENGRLFKNEQIHIYRIKMGEYSITEDFIMIERKLVDGEIVNTIENLLK